MSEVEPEVPEQVEVPAWHLHRDARTQTVTVTHLVCGAVSPAFGPEDGAEAITTWIVNHSDEPHE